MPAIQTDAVHVVFTTPDDTLVALRVANDFAAPLGVPVDLVHFRTVPYSLPLDAPPGISPLETEEFAAHLRAEDVHPRLRVYLCRDERQAMRLAFKPHSLVVMAGCRGWYPKVADRMRGILEAAGHFVVVVDASRTETRGSRNAGEDWGAAAEPTEETFHA